MPDTAPPPSPSPTHADLQTNLGPEVRKQDLRSRYIYHIIRVTVAGLRRRFPPCFIKAPYSLEMPRLANNSIYRGTLLKQLNMEYTYRDRQLITRLTQPQPS